MRVLVTGGRKFADRNRVFNILNEVRRAYPDMVVIEGGAPGADSLSRTWCQYNGVPCIEMPAMWTFYGNAAGGMRNGWMLKYAKPDCVVHFPGGTGTADIIRRAQKEGVAVYAG